MHQLHVQQAVDPNAKHHKLCKHGKKAKGVFFGLFSCLVTSVIAVLWMLHSSWTRHSQKFWLFSDTVPSSPAKNSDWKQAKELICVWINIILTVWWFRRWTTCGSIVFTVLLFIIHINSQIRGKGQMKKKGEKILQEKKKINLLTP